MNSYEQMLLKREELAQMMSVAGMRKFVPLADLAVFAGDDRLCKDLAQLANEAMLVTQPVLHSFPSPGQEDVGKGDILLGFLTPGADKVMLPLADLGLHMMVVGTTNSGKTTFAFWVARQALQLP